MTAQVRDSEVSTRDHLINIAESLFITQGVEGVSLREIVRDAGQKNPSALQYHFGNREGLIDAIVARRFQQLEARRAELLEEVMQPGHSFTLRELCSILVRAPFILCREDISYRDIFGVFGLRLLGSEYDYLSVETSQATPSLFKLWRHGLRSVEHLPAEVLIQRMENAYGAGLLALSRRAKSKGSFRGRRAELFFNILVDQITAMIEAPVSEETAENL